jgi:hypothetical protein
MPGFRPLRLALLAALLSSACDGEHLEPLAEQDLGALSERHVCGDLTLIAADPEGHEGLFLIVDDGLVDAAREAGELDSRYAIGDERIELRLVRGQNVYAGHCGLDSGEPWQVDEVEQAVAGEVELSFIEVEGTLQLDIELTDIWLSPLAAGYGAAKSHARELGDLDFHGLALR